MLVGTTLFASSLSSKASAVNVAARMGSLKVALTEVLTLTSVASPEGVDEVTVGGVVSGWMRVAIPAAMSLAVSARS